jgi:aryl-alcohol dehydrogenase-like predicted oxidoreductase
MVFTRALGKSGIVVSALGLGCLAIGGPWARTHRGGAIFYPGKVDENEVVRAIHRALDLGINFFDTAANYGAGRSERVLGRAIAGRRNRVVIATKFGYLVDEENNRTGFYGGDQSSDEVLEHIRPDCEASLHRLGTDYIDLYQFHLGDYPPDKALRVRDVLENLVADGKIRFYGWSTDNADGARVFAQGKHCVAIQHQFNVIDDAPEMLVVCDQFDQASINQSPLAAGLLTGKYTIDFKFPEDDRRSTDFYQKEWGAPILGRLDGIRDILTSKGRTLAQGALAWIWARSSRTIPIPGFKTVAQVEENVEAMHFGPLIDKQIEQIDVLLERAPVRREREG